MIKWNASPEHSISHYLVRYQSNNGQWDTSQSNETTITLSNLKAGSNIQVKAINEAGLEGWDWAVVKID
jgi:hypothetical protein